MGREARIAVENKRALRYRKNRNSVSHRHAASKARKGARRRQSRRRETALKTRHGFQECYNIDTREQAQGLATILLSLGHNHSFSSCGEVAERSNAAVS